MRRQNQYDCLPRRYVNVPGREQQPCLTQLRSVLQARSRKGSADDAVGLFLSSFERTAFVMIVTSVPSLSTVDVPCFLCSWFSVGMN